MLQAEQTALQNKFKAIESVLSDYQRAQIYTMLMALTTGKSLTVALSDKPGNLHIILSQELPKSDHKFKDGGPYTGEVSEACRKL